MELVIPGYEIKSVIGKGGMAEVYLARHVRLDRDVALKVMLSRYADDQTFSERFFQEARIAANLDHHNVVRVYDVNRHDGQLFLSMEYVRGGDLSEQMRRPTSKAHIIKVIHDLSFALDYANTRGYVHRDVKPANILFREDESLALSDFGIARAIHRDTNMTQTGMVVGTPSYMSPEQAQGLELSGASDLYSVAVIAYQLVTGELPFQADSSISVAIKHISDPIPELPQLLSCMQPFFNKALAKKPEQRYENGASLSQAFAEALGAVETSLPYELDNATTLVSASEQKQRDDTLLMSPSDSGGQDGAIQLAPGQQLETVNDANTFSGAKSDVNTSEAMRNQSNIQLVFMQINKFKVFISEPQKRSVLLTTIVLLLGVGVFALLANQYLGSRKKIDLSPGQQARIGQLLQAADIDINENRLVAPLGNNAYEKYQAILAMSPGDIVAVHGINLIANELENDFNDALRREDLPQANGILNTLIDIQPKVNRGDLKSALLAITKENESRLTDKFGLANEAISDGDTSKAIEFYSEALSIGNGVEASLALREFVSAQIQEAEQAVGVEDFARASEALGHAKHASSFLNDEKLDSKLKIASSELRRKQTKNTLEKNIGLLITNGNAALSEGRLTQSKENNALYYFREVLALSPNDKRAEKGIERVISAIESRITDSLDKEEINNAQRYIESLSNLDSRNPALPGFRTELKLTKQKVNRREAASKKVKALYERANIYLISNRAKSADKTHLQISRLSPNDPGLKALGARIADAYVVLAQREIDAQDWSDVDVWVKKGLVHVPGHKRLLEMRHYAALKLQGN